MLPENVGTVVIYLIFYLDAWISLERLCQRDL